MPYTAPSLNDIVENTGQNIMARLFGAARTAPLRSVVRGLAAAFAGGIYGAYGYINYLLRQSLPDTAESEYLERWAAIFGVTRDAGSQATGTIEISGTPATVAPAGTEWQRSDGYIFTLDADATIGGGGTVSAAVTSEAYEEAANTATAETLSIVSPIAGVDSDATVESPGLTGGADEETDERLQQRLILRIQNPPQGGTESDYEAWTLAANSTITRAFVAGAYPSPGSVTVWPIVDTDTPTAAPSPGVVTDVETYIDARKPLTASVTVATVTESAINVTCSISPDTAAIRAAVEANLLATIQARAGVEQGGGEGTVYLSWLSEAISTATGENSHSITVPAADVTVATGAIGILGTVSFT